MEAAYFRLSLVDLRRMALQLTKINILNHPLEKRRLEEDGWNYFWNATRQHWQKEKLSGHLMLGHWASVKRTLRNSSTIWKVCTERQRLPQTKSTM